MHRETAWTFICRMLQLFEYFPHGAASPWTPCLEPRPLFHLSLYIFFVKTLSLLHYFYWWGQYLCLWLFFVLWFAPFCLKNDRRQVATMKRSLANYLFRLDHPSITVHLSVLLRLQLTNNEKKTLKNDKRMALYLFVIIYTVAIRKTKVISWIAG